MRLIIGDRVRKPGEHIDTATVQWTDDTYMLIRKDTGGLSIELQNCWTKDGAGYSVTNHTVEFNALLKAHCVIAFLNGHAYVVKCRYPDLPIQNPPSKPDLVIGFYTDPARVEEIALRKRGV